MSKVFSMEIINGYVITLVKCAHCEGTGSCKCSYCNKKAGYSCYNIVPCSKCDGSGKRILKEKL